ncbi:MAG: Response regulator receiver domain [Paucimonas sp.]|jgi:DNA-binding NarL/FixJ family response regulator|nr:Response regulator receiver domain [Paucimonas sp.]
MENTEGDSIKKAHLKLLIIDDFDLVRNVLRNILDVRRDRSTEREECDAEQIAIDIQSSPGVVRLDWYMPNMNPAETMSVMKNVLPETNLIHITIANDEAKIHIPCDSGALDCIALPFDGEAAVNDIMNEFSSAPKKSAAIIHMPH